MLLLLLLETTLILVAMSSLLLHTSKFTVRFWLRIHNTFMNSYCLFYFTSILMCYLYRKNKNNLTLLWTIWYTDTRRFSRQLCDNNHCCSFGSRSKQIYLPYFFIAKESFQSFLSYKRYIWLFCEKSLDKCKWKTNSYLQETLVDKFGCFQQLYDVPLCHAPKGLSNVKLNNLIKCFKSYS